MSIFQDRGFEEELKTLATSITRSYLSIFIGGLYKTRGVREWTLETWTMWSEESETQLRLVSPNAVSRVWQELKYWLERNATSGVHTELHQQHG